MSEDPWNEKNNTFTCLSSFYNPFKGEVGNFPQSSIFASKTDRNKVCYI